MPRTGNPYPTDFRDQLVALARAGRNVECLTREYAPCAATIHDWSGSRELAMVTAMTV